MVQHVRQGNVVSLPIVAKAATGNGRLTINTGRLYVFDAAFVLRPSLLVGKYDTGDIEAREAQIEQQIMAQVESSSAGELYEALQRLDAAEQSTLTKFERFAGSWRFTPPPPLLITSGASVKVTVELRRGGPGFFENLTKPTRQLPIYDQIERMPHARARFDNVAGLWWIDFTPDHTAESVGTLLSGINAARH